MSLCTPSRLPRSLHESPAYDPAWRYFQVEEYLRCRRRASETDETFTLPPGERDSLVRAFYKFRTDAPTPKAVVCRYAQQCDDTNDRTFMASRIKAMTVAGLTTEQVANRLHTSVENIEAFQKLFFDIAAYQKDSTTLGALLAPMTAQKTAANARERVWLIAALKLGVRGLDYVMDQRVTLSAEEQREISESIHAILAEQTLSYSLSLQSKPEAGREVMDAYQKSMEMRLRNPVMEDDRKMFIFKEGLIEAARKKYGISAPTPVAR